MVISSGIPDAMKRVTKEILGQYVLTYTSPPAPKDGVRLRVEVRQPNVTVRAPDRVY